MGNVFQENLLRAQITERVLADRFLEAGCVVEWNNEKESGCDMTIRRKGRLHRIEVKDEQNHEGSGNIAIERTQGQDGKPSGISITTADIWVHVFGADGPYVIFQVIPMKLFLAGNRGIYRIIKFGQADNNNAGRIIPRAVLHTVEWADDCESFDELYMSKAWEAN